MRVWTSQSGFITLNTKRSTGAAAIIQGSSPVVLTFKSLVSTHQGSLTEGVDAVRVALVQKEFVFSCRPVEFDVVVNNGGQYWHIYTHKLWESLRKAHFAKHHRSWWWLERAANRGAISWEGSSFAIIGCLFNNRWTKCGDSEFSKKIF